MKIIHKSFDPRASKVRFEQTIAQVCDVNEPDKRIQDITSAFSQNGIICSYATMIVVSFKPLPSERHLFQTLRALYIEAKEIMSASDLCQDIVVSGNYICGIFDSPFKTDIKQLMDVAARLNTLKFYIRKYASDSINYVIGVDYAPIYGLDISSENNVNNQSAGKDSVAIWKGFSMERLIKAMENHVNDNCVYITKTIYDNLSENYQNFFSLSIDDAISKIGEKLVYKSNFYNIAMNELFK